MPKSYKVCPVRLFKNDRISEKKLKMGAQQPLPDVPEPPQTTIYKAHDEVRIGDFQSYIIEHEREVKLHGRINTQRFSAFIQMGIIKAYEIGRASCRERV